MNQCLLLAERHINQKICTADPPMFHVVAPLYQTTAFVSRQSHARVSCSRSIVSNYTICIPIGKRARQLQTCKLARSDIKPPMRSTLSDPKSFPYQATPAA